MLGKGKSQLKPAPISKMMRKRGKKKTSGNTVENTQPELHRKLPNLPEPDRRRKIKTNDHRPNRQPQGSDSTSTQLLPKQTWFFGSHIHYQTPQTKPAKHHDRPTSTFNHDLWA
jgi:hypothetical protein